MAHINIEIKGTPSNTISKKFLDTVKKELSTAINMRTRALYDEAEFLMSSPSPIDGSRTTYGLKGYSSGRGSEIPRRGQQAVHPHTGRMRSNLKWTVSSEFDTISGEIGYDSSFAPKNPGIVAFIDWPKKPTFVVREIELQTEQNYPGDEVTEGETPSEYVPKILLGTRKMIGRNVLRRILINDIQDNTTLTYISDKLRSLISRYDNKEDDVTYVSVSIPVSSFTGRRADGTNPRALGTNPRALGTNPRKRGK